MMDLSRLEDYRENNRLEAKRSLVELPKSIWETYSAFANTYGGMILLGVEEYRDKSLHAIDLPDPEWLIEELWLGLHDKATVNVNILSEGDVSIETVDGKRIVAVRVPRASRKQRPVYIGTDPYSGSYRRTGEGDYRCTREEVRAMLRDAANQLSKQ